ncbi:hypothetical protein [Meiothermus granaticius]|uniref:Uncharacterized protein n=1 Tax=Meiothermus granaticius NBRC 107808 TaxID=1227551 RepID=A0A399F9J2_9DEIN|nr:hypothetical protein [Meiothermus granaticius]MCL6525933.1 hypothetical protein [Thermaceae bacterium]RIH91582.1 hypothetical protein Mgrana_02522 [Meiothermus granaticius NBRC 107808]GEM85433.1 hypothetical protein MGR01S_00580 [Meiothermus granaticius NBRC 107808]
MLDLLGGVGMAEGLLELLSPAVWVSLLQQWPQGEAVAAGMLRSLLIASGEELPSGSGFSGYARVHFNDRLGWLAFRQGKLLEAWSEAEGRCVAGLEAYRALQEGLERGDPSLYRLTPEVILPLLALTRGSLRAAGIPAASVIAGDLFASLGQEGFGGALILEDAPGSLEPPLPRLTEGASGQAWYFIGGQVLFGAEVPPGFSRGRLYLVQMPLKEPPDLREALAQAEHQGRAKQLEALWGAAGIVLREYMGRGAASALDRLRRSHPGEDPAALSLALRHWFENSLEPNAARMFDRLVKG